MRLLRTVAWLLLFSLATVVSLDRLWGDDPPADPQGRVFAHDDSDLHISLREANQFHLHLIEDVLHKFPRQLELYLQYGGILDDPGKSRGRARGSYGGPLRWTVVGQNGVVFSFWMSIRDIDSTGKYMIGDPPHPLFIKVYHIVDFDWDVSDQALDTKQPDLGGISVRDFVKMIERPPEKEM